MSQKITKILAETIAQKALSEQFKNREEVLAADEGHLALFCWQSCFPKDQRDAAEKLAEGWVRRNSCLCYNVDGYSIILNSRELLVVPSAQRGYPHIANITGELAARIMAHVRARDALKEQKKKVQQDIIRAVWAAGTLARLRKEWPEGDAFIPKEVEGETRALAIPFSSINEALGLGA